MDKQQITRIPLKYWPILQTISNESAWKIFKNILDWNEDLNETEKIYFDLIMVDISNIDKKAWDWNKGWRPPKKPMVIENVKPSIDKTSLDKTSLEKETISSNDDITKSNDFDKKEISECFEKVIQQRNNTILKSKNWLRDFKQLPKINIPTKNMKDSFSIRYKEVWKEGITLWLNNYTSDIENRKQDNTWYYNHRFDLYSFLKQSNWLLAFINK